MRAAGLQPLQAPEEGYVREGHARNSWQSCWRVLMVPSEELKSRDWLLRVLWIVMLLLPSLTASSGQVLPPIPLGEKSLPNAVDLAVIGLGGAPSSQHRSSSGERAHRV